jgi:hypothetical protein
MHAAVHNRTAGLFTMKENCSLLFQPGAGTSSCHAANMRGVGVWCSLLTSAIANQCTHWLAPNLNVHFYVMQVFDWPVWPIIFLY